ncbi:hypothetical protein HAV15_010602 [Penicillium sp. str. |nr:hypothetical protein HAV15_010602 [Penicillium sp. str. \
MPQRGLDGKAARMVQQAAESEGEMHEDSWSKTSIIQIMVPDMTSIANTIVVGLHSQLTISNGRSTVVIGNRLAPLGC